MAEKPKLIDRIKKNPNLIFYFSMIAIFSVIAIVGMILDDKLHQKFKYDPPDDVYLYDSSDGENADSNSAETDTFSSNVNNNSAAENNSFQTSAQTETSSVYQPNFPMDINEASAEDLKYVSGIGDVTAQKILDYRASVGTITDITELIQVSGIGEKTVALLCEYFYVSEDIYSPYQPETQTAVDTEIPQEIPESEQGTDEPPQTMPLETTVPTETTIVTEAPKSYSYVHINYASAEELSDALLIDITQAQDIVALREQISYFSAIDELELVNSLTVAEIIEFKDYVIID